MEAIHVLGLGDGLDHLRLTDLFRKRELDEDAVHGVIGVEFGDLVKKFLLRRVGGHPDCRVLDTHDIAGPGLISDISLAAWVVPDEDHYQMRHSAILCRKCGHLLGHPGL